MGSVQFGRRIPAPIARRGLHATLRARRVAERRRRTTPRLACVESAETALDVDTDDRVAPTPFANRDRLQWLDDRPSPAIAIDARRARDDGAPSSFAPQVADRGAERRRFRRPRPIAWTRGRWRAVRAVGAALFSNGPRRLTAPGRRGGADATAIFVKARGAEILRTARDFRGHRRRFGAALRGAGDHVAGNWRRETARWRSAAALIARSTRGAIVGAAASAHRSLQAARRDLELFAQGLTRRDGLVAALALVAMSGAVLSPRLSPETAMRIAHAVPLVERVHIRGELSPVVLSDDAPTLWNGSSTARGRMGSAPQWVGLRLDDRRAISIALALTEGPRVVDVGPSPLWSPYLEAQSLSGPEDPTADLFVAAPSGLEGDPARDGDAYETGTIAPQTEQDPVWDAEDARDDEGLGDQIAPPDIALRPTRRPEGGPDAAPSGGGGDVSIVFTAVGLNQGASRAVLDRLPGAVAVAVPPVADDAAAWVAESQAGGRIVLAEIPMEHDAFTRVNRHDLTLLTSVGDEINLARLAESLRRLPDVDGVATYLGGRFLSDASALRPVVAALQARGLPLIETASLPDSVVDSVSEELGAALRSDVVSIDRGGRSTDLAAGLAELEAAAAAGYAVGVVVALPSSVEAVAAWLAEAEARGYRLVPLRL